MKRNDLFVVEISAIAPPFRHDSLTYFDRIPTPEEILEALTDRYVERGDHVEGFTESLLKVASRGIPTLDMLPLDTGIALEYPDGYLRLSRSHHYTLDASEEPSS